MGEKLEAREDPTQARHLWVTDVDGKIRVPTWANVLQLITQHRLTYRK